MTRSEANKKILEILISRPDLLLVAGCSMPEELFREEYSNIVEDLEARPYFRFIQLLWATGWNAPGPDRFFEESVETLEKLKTCIRTEQSKM